VYQILSKSPEFCKRY